MAFKLHSGKAALRQGHVEAKAVAQWVDMQSLNGVCQSPELHRIDT